MIGILTIIRSILSANMSYYQGRATFAGVEGIFVEIPVLYNKSGNPRVLFCTGDLQRIYEGKLKKDLPTPRIALSVRSLVTKFAAS